MSGFAVLKRAYHKLVMLLFPAFSKQPIFPLEFFLQNNAVFRDVLSRGVINSDKEYYLLSSYLTDVDCKLLLINAFRPGDISREVASIRLREFPGVFPVRQIVPPPLASFRS